MLTVRMNVFLPSLTWVPVFWREKNKQDMKPVLMENAFEAWAAAIRFCDDRKTSRGQTMKTKLLNKEEIKTKMMELTYIQERLAEE